jgi:hypothetical protein
MIVLDIGHTYQIRNHETDASKEDSYQTLQFIKKEKQGDAFVTIQNGTTNEEVLAVLIDRLNTLSRKLPSRETSIAITKCEEALL